MRYRKGVTSISPERDIPVLLAIRNSRAILPAQLCEDLQLQGLERNRRTAYWRFQRLITSGLIERTPLRFAGDDVLVITRAGLAMLESHGHCLLSYGSYTRNLIQEAEALHMLELNELRLSLLRTGELVSWRGELEVVSQNLAQVEATGKDFDSVVTLSTCGSRAIFAIEYERTAKSIARYQDIRRVLESDDRVQLVLYLTPSMELLHLLMREFNGISKPLAFGIANHFKRNFTEAQVLTSDEKRRFRPFGEVLEDALQRVPDWASVR